MTGIIHLHTHSHYSLLEGVPSPGALAQAAAHLEQPALALTDHRCLTGAVEFTLACRQAGVQPILGLELDLSLSAAPGLPKSIRVVLLAQDDQGWANLCRLSSLMLLDPQGNPERCVNPEQLAAHSGGCLLLTGFASPLLSALAESGRRADALRLLGSLAEPFPDRAYLQAFAFDEMDQARLPLLDSLAQESGLPLLAAHPIYTLLPEETALQRTLTAIRLVRPLKALPREAFAPPGAFFPPPDELEARFAGYPRALAAMREVGERCRFELELGVQRYPVIQTPAGTAPIQLLRQKAEAGAKRLYRRITPEIQQRLDHELEVIGARGYEPIFLIMEEIIRFARQAAIPHSSRGSAASSLVAHCLGITSPDPLALNLYFERFLNPARATPPDIDTDICSQRRDEVIQHVFDTYGADRVAMVGTINRFAQRSALGDTAKAYGLSESECRRLTARLPYAYRGPNWEEDSEPFAALARENPKPPYPAIFQDAQALIGFPRHLSVHAGGIVIAPDEMTSIVPVQRSGSKGIVITQFDLDSLEALGLVKLDLLGIRGLSVLGDLARNIYAWRRSEVRSPAEVLDAIPNDDPETSALIHSTRTIGCFQIESPGMRATLKQVQARTLEDVMVALALYRPGPLKGGSKDLFVRRHTGQETTTYLHPALQPLLDETYGVILYQEQVLRIAHELAGLSLADADLLRRAMSHFDPGKQMQALRERFIAGAWAVSRVDEATAARVWEYMAAFAGYGFPKAHAASYAQVAWRSAWCKAHYPAEFMAAVMANWGGYYSQRVYLNETRRLGLTVKPPQINHARREFSVAYPGGQAVLYMGLDQVRDLTARTQERILRLRPFNSLEDFIWRVSPGARETDNLIRCGALEGLGSIPALLRRAGTVSARAGQLSLFSESSAETGAEADWSLAERIAAQEEVLGISVDAHPLDLFADQIAAAGAIASGEAATRTGERVRVVGMRQSSHRSRTAKGEVMAFITLEDLEGSLDVVLFPDAYRRFRSLLSGPGPYLCEGVVDVDESRAEPILKADRVIPLAGVRRG